MLKAYDYSEFKLHPSELQDASFFRREKAIAYNFVLEHPVGEVENICPVCGEKHTRYFFSRWDVSYLFCEGCGSIFLPVDGTTIAQYLSSEEMKRLRISDEYQQQAEMRRSGIWDEHVMWAEYRAFRYLGKNTGLNIIDCGNRYRGSVDRFRESHMCGRYELRGSILPVETDKLEKADVILYMNQLQHETDPVKALAELRESLKPDGILMLNTRLGSGFDILTLKGNMDMLFPYEHVLLPSRQGLEMILRKAGYELLEITTPGTKDIETVLKNREKIEESDFFVKYLIETSDEAILAEFQRFLQKSGLSSFAQAIAGVRK